MKAVVAAFNQEKALVGAFSVITNLRMELNQALVFRAAPCNWLVARHTLAQELESGRQGRSFAGEIRALCVDIDTAPPPAHMKFVSY